MLVHLDGYVKEVDVRKCSNVMFAVITLTDEFFSTSASHTASVLVFSVCIKIATLLNACWVIFGRSQVLTLRTIEI